jgi:hypothetical protein
MCAAEKVAEIAVLVSSWTAGISATVAVPTACAQQHSSCLKTSGQGHSTWLRHVDYAYMHEHGLLCDHCTLRDAMLIYTFFCSNA